MKASNLKCILLCSLMFVLFHAKGQYLQLFVPHEAQLNDTWCWVASMEMVMRFHTASTSTTSLQPLIFRQYAKTRKWTDSVSCTSCNPSISYMIKSKNSHPSRCNDVYSIPFSSHISLSTDYIDMFFQALGYQSSQQINYSSTPIPLPILKKQLYECRPFIAFIDPLTAGIRGGHAIVVKGYMRENNNDFFLANDPWVQCGTKITTIFPYDNFSTIRGGSLQGTEVYSVLSIVGNIRKDEVFIGEDNCKSCDLVSTAMERPCSTNVRPTNLLLAQSVEQEKIGIGGSSYIHSPDTIKNLTPYHDSLATILINHPKKVVGFEKLVLSNKSVDSFLVQRGYHSAKIKFLSIEKLKRCFIFRSPNTIRDNLEHNEDVIEIVPGEVDQDVVSTLQRNLDNSWVLRKFSNNNNLKPRLDLSLNGSGLPVILSNLKGINAIPGSISYEIVKFPPFKYEFYSFQNNGQSYLSPVDNYNNFNNIIKGIAYPEEKIIRKLRIEVNGLLAFYKKNFNIVVSKRTGDFKNFFGYVK